MRLALTKYGMPQVVVLPAVLAAAMIVLLFMPLAGAVVVAGEVVLVVVLVWALAFFRDPQREVPGDENLLLAPADGTVTDIEIVDDNRFIDEPAVRIGIFLSIFSVHINRAPCNVRVANVRYKKGSFRNAMNLESGRLNEANDLELVRLDGPQDRLVVRQISGAIARRIVCGAEAGQELAAGEKFGMIKFGSRTELYLPAHKAASCLVKKGDKVRAGLTPIVKYEIMNA